MPLNYKKIKEYRKRTLNLDYPRKKLKCYNNLLSLDISISITAKINNIKIGYQDNSVF